MSWLTAESCCPGEADCPQSSVDSGRLGWQSQSCLHPQHSIESLKSGKEVKGPKVISGKDLELLLQMKALEKVKTAFRVQSAGREGQQMAA